MLVTNPKIDTMELLYPKRKPVGKVKIDWSNPLTRGLEAWWDMGNRGTDLAGTLNPTQRTGAIFERNEVDASSASPLMDMRVDNTAFKNSIGTLSTGSIVVHLRYSGYDFSVPTTLGVFNWYSSDAKTQIIKPEIRSHADSGLGAYFGFIIRMSPELGGGVDGIVGTDFELSPDEDHYGCITADGSSYSLYVDGHKLQTLVSWTGFNSGYFFADSAVVNGDVVAIGNTGYTGTVSAAGDKQCKFVSIYSEVLTDEQAISITRNPYQFLIPA